MVVLEIKNFGKMKIELDPEAAPITVANFEELVGQGFYDGLIFHRVIENFMIQGGDPTGTGMGSPDQKHIKGEFAANGVKNPLQHKRGTISMARSQNPNSASSQFFICHVDCPFLDGQYAAFGQVVEGIEVVDKIAATRTDYNDRPTEEVVIERCYLESDADPDCLFCKIIAGDIPSKKVYEDRTMLAFADINPQAPTHILVIPKKHIADLNGVSAQNSAIIAKIFEKIPEIAAEAGLTNGYRVISNCGDDACQSVHHLHFHILGGKKLSENMG